MMVIVILLTFQIREEFRAIWATDKTLHLEWQRCKVAILKMASENPKLQGALEEIDNDLDEGTDVFIVMLTFFFFQDKWTAVCKRRKVDNQFSTIILKAVVYPWE